MHHSRPYQNLVEPLIYRRANHLAACSQTVLNPIHRRIPRSVIYNGVDFDALQAPLPEAMRAELRQQQGIQPDDFLIGVTGRIFAGKDPLTVCRAAVRMAEAGRSFRILFLGTGPMRDDVMQFATEAGLEKQIILAGYQSNIRDWLHVLDAFAFPSLAEGLPMALIEAMAVGLPCVVSDFPAASEVITPGRDALQFKRGDDATLATLLMRLQDDPVLGQQLGQTARATVREKFTAKEMARQTAALYDTLINM
jgi:glycosyltransferase involved in cell wall biosynthesis